MANLQAALNKMRNYSNSGEVADNVLSAADTYWNKEAAVHIDGLWELCKDLASHAMQAQDHIEYLDEIINDLTDQCEKVRGENKND